MKKDDLLKEMKNSIGTTDPLIFFDKMVDVFGLLFNRIDELEKLLDKTRINSIMAIKWDKNVAIKLIRKEIDFLRQYGIMVDPSDGHTFNVYKSEIDALQKEYLACEYSTNYDSFCKFWEDTLGYHPFLESHSK